MIVGTGLYDYRFRVMEPETGSFNQRDPLGYVDSMSVYSYAINNPHKYTDPLGLEVRNMMEKPDSGTGASGYRGSKKCNDKPDKARNATCESVRKRLENAEKELEKRIGEHYENNRSLPNQQSEDGVYYDSREGHRVLIRRLQYLVKLLKDMVGYLCDNTGGPRPPSIPIGLPRVEEIPDSWFKDRTVGRPRIRPSYQPVYILDDQGVRVGVIGVGVVLIYDTLTRYQTEMAY